MLDGHDTAVAQDQGALDGVAQLANVTRPRVRRKLLLDFLSESGSTAGQWSGRGRLRIPLQAAGCPRAVRAAGAARSRTRPNGSRGLLETCRRRSLPSGCGWWPPALGPRPSV